MTTAMGPPPARTPNHPATEPEPEPQAEPTPEPPVDEVPFSTPMGPPPPKNPSPSPSKEQGKPQSNPPVPYTIPEWSGLPCHKFYLEVLKDGSIVDQFDVCEKGAYMFGRVDLCDFVLEHPTISRFHAVLQFKRSGDAYLYDLGSTHGTSINKNQVDKKVYVELHVGDVIRFGQSSRLYIFQGPQDLMPPETDRKILREAKVRQERLDREASLRRAKMEASLADGVSWGMGEDAIEEEEDDGDEVTWQTYKGQLTEKQEKTREKIIKRTEKIAHMKKEIDAIRAKDIAQGGLTQGQQTQIARNELRITEIMEELENLEETLNDSIRESLGARAGGITFGKKKGTAEDEEEFSSDDDEFYDRTKKPSVKKNGHDQTIETSDSLLDKRDAIMKEMGEKKELLLLEKNKMSTETRVETEAGDALDAYMSGLSSQLVLDQTTQLEKELSALQSELDRILFLLKIADPSGEAAKRRDSKVQEKKLDTSKARDAAAKIHPPAEPKKVSGLGKSVNISQKRADDRVAEVKPSEPEADKIVTDAPEGKPAVYTVVKPQWLGAVDNMEVKERQQQEVTNIDESDQFVDYKDRQKVLSNVEKMGSEIESAAPGLIIRKRKETDSSGARYDEASEQSTSSSTGAKLLAEDAVALILKHTRGYQAEDDQGRDESQSVVDRRQNGSGKDNKKPKRVLGPEKPTFLNSHSEYDSWVPPEGQSGDGRTSLNDRYGY
ncbi:hypothetical protein Tsubulata_001057 [Turnera subulata]|uniref:FHA domain-containing protein n=1 Tax=Turnera subulata TaxID=218843 RepID=A0A9Q0FKE8_9ROSI|nr:hypothetical protein Tsubulata_001057 [Turnera subulata]